MQDYVAQFIESPSFKPKSRSSDFLDWGVLYPVSNQFIFCMAISVYEVVRVAGFTKQTCYATDKRSERLRKR